MSVAISAFILSHPWIASALYGAFLTGIVTLFSGNNGQRFSWKTFKYTHSFAIQTTIMFIAFSGIALMMSFIIIENEELIKKMKPIVEQCESKGGFMVGKKCVKEITLD